MYTYGWTEQELDVAAMRATARVGTSFEVREVRVRSQKSQRGGQTLQFLLRPYGSTARDRAGGYPPGIKIDWNSAYGKPRSSGAPCYHAFGHFMRALLQMNPNGKIKTGMATYDRMAGFDENHPRVGLLAVGPTSAAMTFAEACECPAHDVEEF